MIEIEILDTGKRLPLSKKERLRMTFQAADFGEAGSGSGSFSTTCSVPITPQVIEALGFSIVPNATSILSAYKNIKARILQDENEIDKGFIRIDEENTTKKELKITFYGRNVDWFTALGDRTLRDLDLSEYDHFKTNLKINEIREDGYVYLPVDYGTLKTKSSATINADEIWPAVFINRLVKQIFKEAGFKVDGTLFDKGEYNRLIMPFSLTEINNTIKTQVNLETTVDADYNKPLPAYQPNTPIKFQWDTRTGVTNYGRTGNEEVDANNYYKLRDDNRNWKIGGIDSYRYTSPADMYVNIIFDFTTVLTSGSQYGKIVSIKKNGNNFLTNIWSAGVNRKTFTNILLNTGDYLEFFVEYQSPYVSGIYGYSFLRIVPTLTAVTTSKFTINSFLPNMKQQTLIEYLFFIYGIIPSFDKNTNTVILDSISDLTAFGAENWSNKVDQSQIVEQRFFDFVSDYAKENICQYETLETDTELEAYRKTYAENYGTGAIAIDNDFLDSTSEYYTAPFYPTITRKVFTNVSNLNLYLPYIFKNDSDIGRICLYTGQKNVSDLSDNIINSITIDGTARTTIPYSYFILPIAAYLDDLINNYHLGFDNPKDQPYSKTSIIQRTYYNLQNVLNKPISITCSLKLTAYDISRLKFNRLKYIQELGGYFYLNKISQYDGSGEPTECELIKWY
jgi:hypothetical protein